VILPPLVFPGCGNVDDDARRKILAHIMFEGARVWQQSFEDICRKCLKVQASEIHLSMLIPSAGIKTNKKLWS
jgi:hypothetical protein